MKSEYLALIARYDQAMLNRDVKAVYRIACEIHQLTKPDEPIDIGKLHAANRIYATDIHGWTMP